MCRLNCATERGKKDVEQVHEEHVPEELVAVDAAVAQLSAEPAALLQNVHVEDEVRSISEMSSCSFGPRPWHIEIRHRVKQNIHN